MKATIALAFLAAAPLAIAQVATFGKCGPVDYGTASGSGNVQYKCDPKLNQWVIDDDAMRALAKIAAQKKALADALISRVLTEKEMERVMAEGYDLFVTDGVGYSEPEKMREFEDALAAQYRLRMIASEYHKKR